MHVAFDSLEMQHKSRKVPRNDRKKRKVMATMMTKGIMSLTTASEDPGRVGGECEEIEDDGF
jgi:hypothetical protein